jgi:hypothetical protein
MSTNYNGFVGAPFFISPFWAPPTEMPAEPSQDDGRDGCTCKKCKQFCPYSIPNQTDKSFICYACRHGY